MAALTLTKQPALSLEKLPYFKRTPRVLTGTAQRLIPAPLMLLGDMRRNVYLVPNGAWYTVKRTRDNKVICDICSDADAGELWLWERNTRERYARWSTAADIADYIYTLAGN